jgi:SAM-dependent methyltransferase
LKKDLNFEKKLIYILFVPLFLIIALWVHIKKKFIHNPKTNFYFFDGVSKNCREIKENAAGWKALDIVYNYRKGEENLFADFWHDLRSSQGTRNRIRLTKFLLLKNIKEISKNNKEVRLISIASGSAQGVVEVIDEVKRKGIIVKAVLIDLDLTAIEHSKKLAQEMKVKDQIIFINKTASFVNEIGREFKPHLIEVVGFLEYRSFNKALKLMRSIYQILENGGILLISQIAPNLESFFLKEVINWLMIYRKPKEVVKLISWAGFNLKNCSFYWEPLKIHYMVECKKL